MTFEITKKIKSALTGDPKKDIEYLTSEFFKYKEHPNFDEISREIGVLIYNCLPDNEKAAFSFVLCPQDNKKDILDEAYEMIKNEQYVNAQIILNEEIKNIRKQEQNRNDCVYLSLNTFFELCVYTEIYNKGVPVRPTPFDFNLFYKLYAYALFKQGKNDKAKLALENALYWNPVSVPCILDLAEIYKIENNLDKMYELTQECFKYVYDRHNLSRCYRNLGFYYTEKEDYETAVCLYVFSDQYQESPKSIEALYKIKEKIGGKLKKPSAQRIKKNFEEKNIMLGPNPQIIKTAVGVGNNARDMGEKEAAEYCYNIVFSLIGDVNIERKIKDLKAKL